MGVRLTGFLAWFAWRTYYLFALPRWERRFRVAFDWSLDLLFPPDIVELKVEPLRNHQGVWRHHLIDQTLAQDATGTLVMLELEAMAYGPKAQMWRM